MAEYSMSLSGRIDTALVKGTVGLLRFLTRSSILLLGLLAFLAFPLSFFEYGEGFSDLSWLELIFIIIVPLLLWRHFHYCKVFRFGYWKGIKRLLQFIGILFCIEMTALGLLITFMVSAGKELSELFELLMASNTKDLVFDFVLLMVVIYLATPTSATDTKPAERAEDSGEVSDKSAEPSDVTFDQPEPVLALESGKTNQ